ncbi:MAG: hypothetical protein ABI895_40330 [Deltaproteobacteria bacterium]
MDRLRSNLAPYSDALLGSRHATRRQLRSASFALLAGALMLVSGACGSADNPTVASTDSRMAPVEGPPGATLKQVFTGDLPEPPEGRRRDPLSEPALAAVREGAPSDALESIDKSVWDNLWCWTGTSSWLCYGDESCFFMFGSICGPSDYAYCDGSWPDYYCVCQSSYVCQ